MNTPDSQLLDAAADHLQRVAGAYSCGRWTCRRSFRRGTTVLAQVDMFKPPRPGSNVPEHRAYSPDREHQAQYELAMQPDTARALIGLLRAADAETRTPARGRRPSYVQDALAAARSILDGSW